MQTVQIIAFLANQWLARLAHQPVSSIGMQSGDLQTQSRLSLKPQHEGLSVTSVAESKLEAKRSCQDLYSPMIAHLDA